MSDTRIVDERVEAYAEEVGRALGGLDSDERAALLEDVREHATAILADEPGVDLTARLGPPRAFAQELLESAGISTTTGSGRRGRGDWRARVEKARASRFGRVLARARTDFAPAWAVLRGVAVTWLVIHLISGDRAGLMPLLLIAGGVAGWLLSERYQRMVGRGRAGRLLGYAFSAATAIVGIVLLTSWTSSLAPGDTPVPEPVAYSALTQDGSPISNIQAFGADGASTPVALFDQYGVPLDGGEPAVENLTCTDDLTVVPVPYLNKAGQPITNAYPARGVCVDSENVVVGPATAVTNGAPVQVWAPSSLPATGRTILVDDNGSYAGLAAGDVKPTPVPTAPAPATPPAHP